MHSHRRTASGGLGLDDPDKRDRRHDLACQYLASPETVVRLWQAVGGLDGFDVYYPEHEVLIAKGEGQYATTIGFVDLVLRLCRLKEGGRGPYEMTVGSIAVEVKVGPVGVGEMIRQVRLYRKHFDSGARRWVVATCFSLGETDVDTLRAADIVHVRLGDTFVRWADCRARERPADSPSV